MTDSALVFPVGFAVTDSDNNAVPGAVIAFTSFATDLPLTVHADRDRTIELGTSITCDSAGRPSNGSARVLVYVGTTPYNVLCTDANGVTLWQFTNVSGALDTSAFITSSAGTVTYTVTPVSTSGTWTTADINGALYRANPSGGNFTRTLPPASSCQGRALKIIHVGSSGVVGIRAAGSDLIWCDGADTARGVILLTQRGDTIELVSDGVDWNATVLRANIGPRIFVVEDRVAASPASPTMGQAFFVNDSPTGSWASLPFPVAAADIAIFDGNGSYQIHRPTTDCGWLCYIKATGVFFQFRGSAWSVWNGTTALYGLARWATQAEMEAASSTTIGVCPANLHYHPAATKASVSWTGATGVVTSSYNVTSISRTGTGAYTINFTAGFGSGNYAAAFAAKPSGSAVFCGVAIGTPSSTSCSITTYGVTATPTVGAIDPTTVTAIFTGDI